MDKIEGKLSKIFSNTEATGHAAESFHTENLSPDELDQTVEKALATTLVGRPCFSCGEAFDEKSALESYFLGPLAEDNKATYAHKTCFEETIKIHPELQATINTKPANTFTPEEIELWKTAFSDVRQNSTYYKLFRNSR